MKNGRYCILAIDDEESILALLREVFKNDYHVLTTSEPEEALEHARSGVVDLVVCDQRMPKLTGALLLSQIKAIQPNMVRILLTGYSDFNDAIDAVNLGSIHRYEAKPIEMARLRKLIAEQLKDYEIRNAALTKAKKIEDMEAVLQELDDLV